jgi:hypothetical protein
MQSVRVHRKFRETYLLLSQGRRDIQASRNLQTRSKHSTRLACSYTLKVKVTYFSQMSVDLQQTSRRRMPSSGMFPCDSCDNQRFGGACRFHHQIEKNQRARNSVSINQLAYSFHSDDGSDMLLRNVSFARATRRHIPEGGILHSHRR